MSTSMPEIDSYKVGSRSDCITDELLQRATAIADKMSQYQTEYDEACQLSDEVIHDLCEAQFFRVLQPHNFGGLELPAETLFQIEIELAKANMSAAWVMANMGVAAFHAALFAREAQEEIWGDNPDARIATSNMPGGKLTTDSDGQFQLSGYWRFSSGAKHADWFILGALLPNEENTIAGGVLIPRQDVSIIEDWDVIGLRATGSHAIKVSDIKIPSYRFLPHIKRYNGSAPGRLLNAGPLYSLPLPQMLFRSISSASIGGLRGMLSQFLTANQKRSSMMGQRIAHDPHILDLCGRVDADLKALESGLVRDFEDMRKSGCAGTTEDLALRRAIRLNVTRIPDQCFRLAIDLYRAAGAAALYRNNIILRFFNDLMAARQHAANQYELHARSNGAALFGDCTEDILL